MATRSPRRSGGRSWVPRLSVDSQIGPSTRVATSVESPGRASPGATRRPSDVSATTGWWPPYSAGRMSSVIPASRTTWRPDRSRTCRTRASSQPARATSARPGSMASRVGRRSAGIASSRAGSSRANRATSAPAGLPGRTGNPPPMSSVSNVAIDPRHSAVSARPLRTASRQASTAPSCEPTCRWMPRGRSGPSGPPPASTARAMADSSIPNLLRPAPPPARPASPARRRD